MGRILKTLCLSAGVAMFAWPALANDKLIELEKDANQWVSPTQNYANTRFSTLDQINKSNVKNLQVAWTFSTGVLRGHEGGPLVIGDTMYVHTPFPNIVYALDLNNDGAIKWKYEPVQDPNVIPIMCCDTVNRGVAYAPAGDGYPALIILHQADTDDRRAQRRHRRRGVEGEVRRSEPRRDRHQRADGREGQGHQRRVGRRVRRAGLRRGLQSEGRLRGLARLFDGHRTTRS